ncbi:MAG: Trm112 family protein [Microthrixaceae bacterium]
MALSPVLLEVLACPEDKGPLYYLEDENALYNPRLTRRYRIEEGDIPVMLIEEAETVDGDEHERIMAKVAADAIKPTFEADDADGAAGAKDDR